MDTFDPICTQSFRTISMPVERVFELAMILNLVVPHSSINPFALVPLNTFGICKKSVVLGSLADVSPLDCNFRLSNIGMDDQGHIEDARYCRFDSAF